MKSVKQQYQQSISISQYQNHHKSAFNIFSDEYEKNIKIGDKNIQTYMNKRKCQNSFTLSDIEISSDEQDSQIKEQIKVNLVKLLTEIPQQKLSSKNENLNIIKTVNLTIQAQEKEIQQKSIKPKMFSIKTCAYQIKILPFSKVQTLKTTKRNVKIEQSSESNQNQDIFNKFYETRSENIKLQSQIPNKKQKIIQKKKQKAFKKENIPEMKKNHKTTKKQVKEQIYTKKEIQKDNLSHDEIAFDGVLRNCNCCGKLITKLCFKCPHIYCLAENCPRKRKKILNQKMLQRMKQQKIEEHYRQRALYEKMKTSNGQNVNGKLENHNKKLKNSKKRKDETSIEFYECQTSEGELDQDELCDKTSQEQIDKRNKLNNRNIRTRNQLINKKDQDQDQISKNLNIVKKDNRLINNLTVINESKKQKKKVNLYFSDSNNENDQ